MKHLGTKRMETERLILRPFTREDAQAMFDNWANDPEVTKYLTWPAHDSLGVTQWVLNEWVQGYEKPDFYQWAIVPKDYGQPVGCISVVEKRDDVQWMEIGYCMGKQWWGKGIMPETLKAVMTYLFEEVGVLRLQACHDVRNPNSGAVMRKCGMTYEGTLRQYTRNNQGICDVSVYSILKAEYDRKHSLLCELNDAKLLGTEAVSTNAPRLAARAVVRNRQGLIALSFVERYKLYSLPGGGLEPGENPEEALRREIREETGCTCGNITALGVVYENRGSQNFVQQSYYFLVEADRENLGLELTEKERSNGTQVLWVTWEEAFRRIDTQDVTMSNRKFVRARDLAALNASRGLL
jgi:ribosomal-protein-alanine N-acetyltransferase